MIQAILFDFDDTLINTLETKISALQETARYFYHFHLTEEAIKKQWGKPYHALLQTLFLETGDSLEHIMSNYESIAQNYPASLYDDIVAYLPELLQKTLVGIVTSARRFVVTRDLHLVGLDENMFFYIQTADDTSVYKPDPAVFVPILNELAKKGISKEKVVYVGDTFNDYLAAKGAGLRFFAFADRTTPKETFVQHAVPMIDSLRDLFDLVTTP
jgi:HAD superfamily hydrolase (TIGR01549 family)